MSELLAKSVAQQQRRIIARSSGHHVMIDRPDVIGRNVNAFLQAQKGNRGCPLDGETEQQ